MVSAWVVVRALLGDHGGVGGMKAKKTIVFVIEYKVDVEDNMDVALTEVLEQMRGSGSAEITDVRIEEAGKSK
jgi:hypothetical protein